MGELGIGVVGASGRMGQMLIRTVTETVGVRLVAATERPGSAALGRDAGEVAGLGSLGVSIGDNPAALFHTADAVLEFSAPAATTAHAALASQNGKIHVIGTTGLTAQDEAALAESAKRTQIVYAPNMSVIVTLAMALVEQVAGILGPDYDIEVLAVRYRHRPGQGGGARPRRRPGPSGAVEPGGSHRSPQGRGHRLRHAARRRCGRRPYGRLRRRGGAAGDHPSRHQPADLRARRSALGALGARQGARPVRHA
jgi:hypothetical protein